MRWSLSRHQNAVALSFSRLIPTSEGLPEGLDFAHFRHLVRLRTPNNDEKRFIFTSKCSHRVQGPQIDLQLRGFVFKMNTRKYF